MLVLACILNPGILYQVECKGFTSLHETLRVPGGQLVQYLTLREDNTMYSPS